MRASLAPVDSAAPLRRTPSARRRGLEPRRPREQRSRNSPAVPQTSAALRPRRMPRNAPRVVHPSGKASGPRRRSPTGPRLRACPTASRDWIARNAASDNTTHAGTERPPRAARASARALPPAWGESSASRGSRIHVVIGASIAAFIARPAIKSAPWGRHRVRDTSVASRLRP